MTHRVILTGGSDDLAEIHGDIEAEFPADIYKRGRFIFDTGSQVELFSNPVGGWRMRVVTPDNVVNTDEFSFELGTYNPRDETLEVVGDFTEIVWVSDWQSVRIPEDI